MNLSRVSHGAIQLMKRLMYINPTKRITATEAISNSWFNASPYATRPGTMDIKGEFHEIQQQPQKPLQSVMHDRRYTGRGGKRGQRRGRGRRPY